MEILVIGTVDIIVYTSGCDPCQYDVMCDKIGNIHLELLSEMQILGRV